MQEESVASCIISLVEREHGFVQRRLLDGDVIDVVVQENAQCLDHLTRFDGKGDFAFFPLGMPRLIDFESAEVGAVSESHADATRTSTAQLVHCVYDLEMSALYDG